MKIYLASRYSRREELCGYREQLRELGHEVTSRWLNGGHQIATDGTPIGDNGEALVEGHADSPDAAYMRESFAWEDWQDVMAADAVISFTEPPRTTATRGGRHVEFGMAAQAGKFLIVVGYRENIFHWLRSVHFAPDWNAALDLLTTRQPI